MKIINIAGYVFVNLSDLESWQQSCKDFCRDQAFKGSVVFSPEGVNIMLAGEAAAIEAFITWLKAFPEFNAIEFKYSESDFVPFKRTLIKIKKALVHGMVNPISDTAPNLSPEQLKRWYDEGKEFVIIDTRNDYELALGKFENALDINLNEFKSFEAALEQVDTQLKEKPAVFYCTGGIRCEKAAPLAKRAGFKEVYQLEGGILNYFKECKDAHYQGNCYVFDERIALTPELKAIHTPSPLAGESGN